MKKALLLWLLLLSLCAPVVADENEVVVKGDVAYVDILRVAGAYLETLLWVWSDAPSLPLQPVLLRCDGDGSGSLGNCLYPTAFLACPIQQQTWADFYEPALTTTRYSCGSGARKDAGECVRLTGAVRPLDGFTYSVFSGGHAKSIQALSLDVTHVGYESGCSLKP